MLAGANYTNDTWTGQNVYLAPVNGSDLESGHNSTIYTVSGANTVASTSSATTITNAGTSTVTVTTTDIAGNSATRIYTVKIDRSVTAAGTMIMKLINSSRSELYK